MEVVTPRIVSIPIDVITMLHSYSKEAILFYVLALAGETEENIKISLNLSEEEIQGISSHLAKKNLVMLEKAPKKLAKQTYMDKLIEFCEKHISEKTGPEGLDRIARAKLVAYFFSELTGRKFTSDVVEAKIQSKLDQGTFQQLIEAIWRNHHNIFCNGGNDQKWSWDLNYLMRLDTIKSQPLEKSLKRWLDIPVSDKSLTVLEKFIGAFPALSYIKTIPCKYENIRPTDSAEAELEVQRKQREIKQSLGLDIKSL